MINGEPENIGELIEMHPIGRRSTRPGDTLADWSREELVEHIEDAKAALHDDTSLANINMIKSFDPARIIEHQKKIRVAQQRLAEFDLMTKVSD